MSLRYGDTSDTAFTSSFGIALVVARKIVVWAALTYIMCFIGLYALQRHVLFQPSRGIPDVSAVGVPALGQISLRTRDDLVLSSWYKPPPDYNTPVIVFFQGNSGNINSYSSLARLFASADYGLLMVGYRGYNGNPGTPSESGFYMDARTALDYLQQKGIPQDRVVLYGETIGSGVALQMAVERRVGGVVLESPFLSAPDVADWRFVFPPIKYVMWDLFDNIAKVDNIHTPLLIMYGGKDTAIPPEQSRRLYDQAKKPKDIVFFPEASHNGLYDFGASRSVLAFLKILKDRSYGF